MTKVSSSDHLRVDVLVVGTGNAGLCAALAALETGAEVLVIDKAPKEHRGGNTHYTGFYRFPYDGLEDLSALAEFPSDVAERAQIPAYSVEDFLHDLVAPSGGRADETWMRVLAEDARDTMQWLAAHGMNWDISREGARESGDHLVWQPGTVVKPTDGGLEIVRSLLAAVTREGGDIAYDAALTDLIVDDNGAVIGGIVAREGGLEPVYASSVVLAAGGFEASPERRARYLGSGWDVAKVRGTRYNTGECLDIALRLCAATSGEWTGCHATMVHGIAPDAEMGEEVLFPLAYPFGILVDRDGRRFFDEGEHFYLHTYAKLGKMIMERPGGRAFQIFDAKSKHLLKAEGAGDLAYAVAHETADNLDDLAKAIGLAPEALIKTVEAYNAAVQEGPFDPSRLDGKRTRGLDVDKTNWAVELDTPPYEAYPVDCGITFTYGGLKSSTDGEVLNTSGRPIAGLYVAGEMAGSFYSNYAGGSGLTKGAVFGRRAGVHAARKAQLPVS